MHSREMLIFVYRYIILKKKGVLYEEFGSIIGRRHECREWD